MTNFKGAVALGLIAVLGHSVPASAAVDLIASGVVKGDSTDLSGLTGYYDGDQDRKAQLGCFGSGIAYLGSGYRFVGVNDRGFSNGDVAYDTRFQLFTLSVDAASHKIGFHLDATRFFTDEAGNRLLGSASSFNTGPNGESLRFDAEGVRASGSGHIFVSDEYGPYVCEFDASGRRVRQFAAPPKFQIKNPNEDADTELTGNTSGRQTNRGFEGLAISPDDSTLFAILQSPLIQDGALNARGKRVGVNSRILRIDIATGKTQEYVYQLSDGVKHGINELLAVNDHEFLAIERDGKGGDDAKSKLIELVDIHGATDVSGIEHLPAGPSIPGVTPVSKTAFIDLLNPKFHLAGPGFPEKVEGLAFGPATADGRLQLFVTTDNDLIPTQDTHIWDFAIDRADLPGYTAQHFSAGLK